MRTWRGVSMTLGNSSLMTRPACLTAMASHSARLYHLGACEVSRSTLADANSLRPHQVFSGLFNQMVAQAGRVLRDEVIVLPEPRG